MPHRRGVALGALCGLLGPAGFITGWLVAGALRPGYSYRRDAISQLARRGTPRRHLMTTALFAFGAAVPVFGRTLAHELGDPPLLEAAVALAGLGTIGVAAAPLGEEPGGPDDRRHTAWAIAGYVGTAAGPLLAAGALSARGRRLDAATSLGIGAGAAACLIATAGGRSTGLFQRLGLTMVDCWFMALALELLEHGRLRPPPRTRRSRAV